MLRKPLGSSVAVCVLEHGTGALNIDATRVQMSATDREFILKYFLVGRPRTQALAQVKLRVLE
jgi:hypothetical protein